MKEQIKKIKKLLEKAESTKKIGNLEEAAVFAAKANDLLMKYNLEIRDLEIEDESELTSVEQFDMDLTTANGGWKLSLMTMLAKSNMCEAVFFKIPGSKMKCGLEIYGRSHNIDITLHMFDFFIGTIDRLKNETWKKEQDFYKAMGVSAKRFTKSFCYGAMQAIHDNIKKSQEASSDVMALVRVESEDIKKFMKDKCKNLTTRKFNADGISAVAYGTGYNKGKSIRYGKPVNAAKERCKIE